MIPAAGSGLRFGTRMPKAFVTVAGAPLVIQTLRAFQASPEIEWIVVAAPPAHHARLRRLVARQRVKKLHAVVAGGPNRSASVAAGVAALPPEAEWVMIHDGARPCVTPSLIRSTVQAVKRFGAVACGLPAPMTVKAVDAHHAVRLTLERDSLWCVQTPQAFRRAWLEQALALAGRGLEQFPDDAAILEWAGFPVRMIPGDPLNIKVTTKDDLIVAEAILKRRRRP